MSIYEIVAYLCLFLALVPKAKNSKSVFWTVSFILLVIASIRGLSVGTDTLSYYEDFCKATNTRFDAKQLSEPIYSYWTYYCRTLTNSYDLWILVNYGIIIGTIEWATMKNSTYLLLSIFLFVTCGFYLASFNGMREYMATGIIMLMVHVLQFEKWKWKFWSLFFMGILIHNTTIIALSLLFIRNFNLSKFWQVFLVLSSFVIGFFYLSTLSDSLFVYIAPFMGRYESYLLYEGDDEARNFISNFGVNFMFLFSVLLVSENTMRSMWFKAYFLSMIVFNLVGGMFWLTRLTDNLAIAQIIAIPLVFSDVKKRLRMLFIYGFIVVAYSLSRFYLKSLSNPDILPYMVRPDIFVL